MAQKRFNLLIIDDEQDFLTEIKHAFAYYPQNEFEIETARSGEEGLAKLRERRFDVALIDIHMPDSKLSGLDVIRQLNEENIYLGLAIATGQRNREDAVAAVNLGAQAWFDKPLLDREDKLPKLHQRLKELAQVIPDDKIRQFFSFFENQAAA
jgi:ActR/RegA family two-component response regulator